MPNLLDDGGGGGSGSGGSGGSDSDSDTSSTTSDGVGVGDFLAKSGLGVDWLGLFKTMFNSWILAFWSGLIALVVAPARALEDLLSGVQDFLVTLVDSALGVPDLGGTVTIGGLEFDVGLWTRTSIELGSIRLGIAQWFIGLLIVLATAWIVSKGVAYVV